MLETRLRVSTSDHPETDGQTERENRVVEKFLREFVHTFSSWSEILHLVEFAINNSAHASINIHRTSSMAYYIHVFPPFFSVTLG